MHRESLYRCRRLGRRARLLSDPGQRLLPIMAARWILNSGTALAIALDLAG